MRQAGSQKLSRGRVGSSRSTDERRGAWLRILFLLGSLALLPSQVSAQLCGTPGNDGPGGTLSGVVNTYYPGTGTANAGATTISVGASNSSGALTPVAVGDLLLVIQMQDATITSTNTNNYGASNGTGSGATSYNSSGRYEYVIANSALGIGGGTVTIRGTNGNGLINTYTAAAATSSKGQMTFQVIRVPQYSSATLSSGLTAAPWDGSSGGVLAIDVAGNLTASGTVSVDELGFRGGGAQQLAGGSGARTDYRTLATNAANASKAEGVAGTPRYMYDGFSVIDNTIEGYPNGSFARGAPGNAGGGGTDGNPAANDENSGGGGGGNGGAGGTGGNSWSSNRVSGGLGGSNFTVAAVDRIVLGGGGGAGSRNNSSGTMSSGGRGGGIVMIRAGSVSGAGTISANGGSGITPLQDGGGGGGAGGSILVVANSGGLGSLSLRANGGRGSDAWPLQAPGGTPGERHGPGGGGGGGFVVTSSATTTSVSGGANGVTTTASDPYGSTPGAGGSSITITASQVPGASAGAQCFPTITTTKTTSTATVTNTPAGTTATYSIVVANAANRGTAINLAISDTLPANFTYSSTSSVTLAGGATRPSTTNPSAGAAVPSWSTFTVPGGGSVTITFVVQIAGTVVAGTYQNPASGTYSDPARTVAGGTLTASYNSASSTGEDVAVRASDLTIAKSHTGNFTQGQTNAPYTITVTNSGNASTTAATVTVTDTLPAGLTYASASPASWTCSAAGQVVTCTASAVIAAGASYPALTINVNISATAPASVTNDVTVSGGGQINTSNDSASDPTTINQLPDLTIAKSHVGNFTQGQVGATYSITATNSGFAATSGTVTVTDTLPAGLTATAISGTGWACVLGTLTCTRSDALAAGSSYPVITLTVTVANNAPASVTNSVSVSGGGQTNTTNDTATNPTTINQLPDLTIAKSHVGNFTQGQVGATYSITATNSGFAPTSGTVTVVDTLPAGLTATAISGTGWACVLGTLTCTRSDLLAAGSSYPVITLTVNVSLSAPASVTNSATVSGGGETNAANDTASDATTINAAAPPNIGLVKSVSPSGTQNPGTDLLYTIAYTNSGGQPANNFIIVDPNPANAVPAERVFNNVDFKVGSLTSSPGSSGLVAAFAYSNDGGTTWTYTPVSGGGGAPAGYDRNVTNVRWSFAGSLNQTGPNNTGSVTLTVRIR